MCLNLDWNILDEGIPYTNVDINGLLQTTSGSSFEKYLTYCPYSEDVNVQNHSMHYNFNPYKANILFAIKK